MKAGIGIVVVAITYFLRLVFAITITENTVQTWTFDLSGDLTINPGVYYSIVNNALTAILGSVDNEGGFYTTSSGGIASSVTMTAGSFLNNGIISFNSLRSTVGSFFNIQPLLTFTNNGQMFLGVSNGGLVNMPFNLGSGLTFTNRGIIVLQSNSGQATATIGTLNTVNNPGSICLFNTIWSQTTSVNGNGCTTAGPGSQLNVQGLTSFSQTQTIYLSSSTSKLNILGLSGGLLTSPPTYKVAGFGGGNTISSTFIFTNLDYSRTTGILTLSTKDPILGITLSSMKISIGPGYIANRFITSSGGILGVTGKSITYNAPAPNDPPSICSCEFTFPSVTTTPIPQTKYTTTFVSTKSDGSVETDSGIVAVSTDSAGSLTSSTSLFPQTKYTTTFVSTKSDGSVETDSGVVAVSTDSAGSLTSSTSLFPQIKYTTTFMSTKSDGSVETDSGIVAVSTDSAGSSS